jgi:hypothetical protein
MHTKVQVASVDIVAPAGSWIQVGLDLRPIDGSTLRRRSEFAIRSVHHAIYVSIT